MIEFFQRRLKFSGFEKKKGPEKPSRGIYWVVGIWIFLALFADLLSNELPLSCTLDGKRYFPALEESWSKLTGQSSPRIKYLSQSGKMDNKWMPLIPYSPGTIDRANAGFVGPFSPQHIDGWRYRHWLGTDGLGRDVLAGLVHGSRIAIIIGLLSVLLAMIMGVIPGAIAGYFGDKGWRVNLPSGLIGLAVGALLIWVIAVAISSAGSRGNLLLLTPLIILTGWLLHYLRVALSQKYPNSFLKRSMSVPLDIILLRIIEVFRSLPALFILLALLAIVREAGILQMALILALIMWPSFARYTRAEFIALREQEFVAAAKLLRKSHFNIIFREILPNAVPPIAVVSAFGLSSAILAESTLSFLGIGLSADTVSWGSMLNEARKYFGAWWLAIFPGLAIFVVVFTMNSLGDFLSRKYSSS